MSYNAKVYKKQGGAELVVASGGKITIKSGGTLEAESGAVMTLPDIALQVGDLALAEGSIIVGNNAGKAVALSAKTTTQILVGNGTTITSVALSGDATMTNAGAVSIANGAVTAAKLANNAAGLNSVGMGASASYAKTTTGVQTLATGTAGAKTCLFVVAVTETFVTNGAGNEQPTFTFGEVGTAAKFAAAALFTDATVGQIKVFPGSLTAATNVIVTATAAAGSGAGAIAVSVIILPTAS